MSRALMRQVRKRQPAVVTKLFNGKRFQRYVRSTTKSNAQSVARDLRKGGNKARVVKHDGSWTVFWRRS